MLILKPSPIHGVGVFTTAALRRGSDPHLYPTRDWRLGPCPRGALLRYAVPNGRGQWYRPREPHRMSMAWYLNHSARPNICARTFTAVRHVRAGEELTINYDHLTPDREG